jgi:hypothetical protein
MTVSINHNQKSFLTVKQWLNKYPAIPEGGIRHLIFTNKDNFNSRVVKKLGRKILLDEQAFLSYIDEHSKS